MVSSFKTIIVVLAWHFFGLGLGFLSLFPIRVFDDSGDLALQILFGSLLAGILTSLIFWRILRIQEIRKRTPLVRHTKLTLALLLASSLFFFNLSVLVQTVLNTDRSRSTFVLSWIECSPKDATRFYIQTEIEKKFGEESANAFDKRVSEHIKRGLVSERQDKLALTWAGESVHQISNHLAKFYNLQGPKENSLWGKNNDYC